MKSVRIPGRRLILPSKGLMYTVGNELNCELIDGEVTIIPLTMRDEMMLSSPDMIISGEAVTNVISKCVKEIKEPTQLFFNDVIAILTYLKMVTYGNAFPVDIKHECSANNQQISINIDEFIRNNITFYDSTLQHELIMQYSDCRIILGYPRYIDQIRLIEKSKIMYDADDTNMAKYDFLLNMITSNISKINLINDDTVLDNKSEISKFIEEAPASIISDISTKVEEVSKFFGVNPVVEVKCPNCGEKIIVDLPLDPTLFF